MRRYNPETDGCGTKSGHYTRLEAAKDRAKAYAASKGHEADRGGYIKTCTGYPICQGWLEYYRLLSTVVDAYDA